IDGAATGGGGVVLPPAYDSGVPAALQYDKANGIMWKLAEYVSGPYGTSLQPNTGLSRRIVTGTGINTLTTSIPDTSFSIASGAPIVLWYEELGAVLAANPPMEYPLPEQFAKLYKLQSGDALELASYPMVEGQTSTGTNFGQA